MLAWISFENLRIWSWVGGMSATHAHLGFINKISNRWSSTHWLMTEWSPQQWVLFAKDWGTKQKYIFNQQFQLLMSSRHPTCVIFVCFISSFPFSCPVPSFLHLAVFICFTAPAGILMPICICARRPSVCFPSTHWSAWLVLCYYTPASSHCYCSAACWQWPHCRIWGR